MHTLRLLFAVHFRAAVNRPRRIPTEMLLWHNKYGTLQARKQMLRRLLAFPTAIFNKRSIPRLGLFRFKTITKDCGGSENSGTTITDASERDRGGLPETAMPVATANAS